MRGLIARCSSCRARQRRGGGGRFSRRRSARCTHARGSRRSRSGSGVSIMLLGMRRSWGRRGGASGLGSSGNRRRHRRRRTSSGSYRDRARSSCWHAHRCICRCRWDRSRSTQTQATRESSACRSRRKKGGQSSTTGWSRQFFHQFHWTCTQLRHHRTSSKRRTQTSEQLRFHVILRFEQQRTWRGRTLLTEKLSVTAPK